MVDETQDQVTDAEIDPAPALVHRTGSLRGQPKYLPGKGSGVKRTRNKQGAFKRVVRLTDERKTMILTYLRRGSHLETAFAAAGIPGSTYRSWMVQADEALHDAKLGSPVTARRKALILFLANVEQAQAQFEQSMINVVAGAAHAGTYTAALAMLERRFPDRWAKREDRDLTVNLTAGFQYVQVSSDPGAGASPVPASHDLTPGDPITSPDHLLPAPSNNTQDVV